VFNEEWIVILSFADFLLEKHHSHYLSKSCLTNIYRLAFENSRTVPLKSTIYKSIYFKNQSMTSDEAWFVSKTSMVLLNSNCLILWTRCPRSPILTLKDLKQICPEYSICVVTWIESYCPFSLDIMNSDNCPHLSL